MADIDFITDLANGGFAIAVGDSPESVSGNRALVNRFEITFLTKTKIFLEGSSYVIDNYGGNADKFINKPHVLSDIQSISAAVSTSIDHTVSAMKADEPAKVSDTERLSGAELESIDVVDGVVVARVRVIPVEVEDFNALSFRMPITRF